MRSAAFEVHLFFRFSFVLSPFLKMYYKSLQNKAKGQGEGIPVVPKESLMDRYQNNNIIRFLIPRPKFDVNNSTFTINVGLGLRRNNPAWKAG